LPRRARILYCANFYPPNYAGGAELVAHAQAAAVQRSGREVAVFAGNLTERGRQYAVKKGSYEKLPVVRVNLRPADFGVAPLRYGNAAVENSFTALLREFRPDVVHFHNLQGLPLRLADIARDAGARTVLTLHDYAGFCFKNTLLKRGTEVCADYSACAECLPEVVDEFNQPVSVRARQDFFKAHLGLIDEFISPSAFLAGAYVRAGFPSARFSVVGNGVDVSRFSRVERKEAPGRLRFTCLGYFGKHKGISTLLEALSFLPAVARVTINLAGEGPELPSYRAQMRELGVRAAVRFWGKVDYRRIAAVYHETDVVVVPSIWPENQPGTILEGMASRLPVIASRIGGIPELVEEGVTGLLFEARDARQLSERIRSLLENPGLARSLGTNAFEKISGFTFENQARLIAEIYDRD
jgi:glycosyltransferase involved in cell wall biosynthesis